jgi:hypothetical protein
MQTKLIVLCMLLTSLVTAQVTTTTNETYSWKEESNPFTFETIKKAPKKGKYFSVQFMGLTIHPGGGAVRMVENYPLKLDDKAYLVLNVGATVAYDVDLSKKFFLRSSAGFFMDCAYLKSGFLHIGFRWNALQIGRHTINAGVGPTLMFREDWHRFENYNDADFFGKRVYNGWQYRFFPVGGEVEYLYRISDKWQFQYSVIPGYPAVITSKIGLRYKINN